LARTAFVSKQDIALEKSTGRQEAQVTLGKAANHWSAAAVIGLANAMFLLVATFCMSFFNGLFAALCFRHEGNNEQEAGYRAAGHEQKGARAAYMVADIAAMEVLTEAPMPTAAPTTPCARL